MPEYRPPVADLKFVLNDVLEVAGSALPGFEALDEELISSTIDVFGEFAGRELAPLNTLGDNAGAKLGPDGVTVPDEFVAAYRTYIEGGWPSLTCRPEDGGDGMPALLQTLLEELLAGANLAFAMAPLTAPGAYRVLADCASDDIKGRYLPKIVSGEWGTAMSLTEPQCGSALGLLKTRAEPDSDGGYRITGTKMFNSWGDHDMAENIVHLVLARLPEAPAGVKGISLFAVSKYLVDADGRLGSRNNFSVGSLEKKLGVHASPTCVTNFDGAKGYLVGQPHRGMAAMFIIMNSMRLASGVCAVGVAEAAYQNALSYTRERIAGRSITGAKYPALEGDPIIVHPDVRRMLMSQRAFVQGGRAFAFWVGLNLSLSEAHADPAARSELDASVSLLTPVVKAFLTDKGFESADAALQCFGGHGYVRDNGAEQYLRDIRMLRIGEGTSGIQAMDFIGRKVVGDEGRALENYFDEIRATTDSLDGADLDWVVTPLRHTLESVAQLTREQLPRWKADSAVMAAVAMDYLHLIGYLSLGFAWAKMAATATARLREGAGDATFLQNKLHTARFYFGFVLIEVESLQLRVCADTEPVMAIPDDRF